MFTFEATKTTPFAPSELEGEYKLTIKGRHMKMTKLMTALRHELHVTRRMIGIWLMESIHVLAVFREEEGC